MKIAVRVLLMSVIAGAIVCAAQAQSYPTRPVRLVIPYPPGGGTDIIGRVLAQKLGENLGQTVVVDNRPGANGNVGMEHVARSAPDGYTLAYALFAQFAVNPALYPKLSYDPLKDFVPITLLVRSPYILMVHPTLPARSTKELVALARQRPGQLAFSSAGNGSGAHLCGEMLKTLGKFDMVHVPYKGAGALLPDLVAGQVQLSFVTWASGGPHARSGRLRPLAVTTPKRSQVLPDLPAVAETLPGYDVSVWYGVVAPAATPREIVTRLHAEIVRVLATPEFRQRLQADAIEPIGSSPEQFGEYIRSELVKWAKLVKASGVKID